MDALVEGQAVTYSPLATMLPFIILFLVVLPLHFTLGAKKVLQQMILQGIWIGVVEKLFYRPRGFPRLGSKAIIDVCEPRWLEDSLAAKFPGTIVKSASAKSMGADMGNASTMFRLTIEYISNPHDLPKVMIAKLAKEDLKARLPFTATRMNEMETLFYSTDLVDFLRDKGLKFSRGFGGRYSKFGGNCYSLMEDVTQEPQCARFTTEQQPVTSTDEARRIVKTLGRLHGSLFDKNALLDTQFSWVIRQRDPLLNMTKEFFLHGWTTFIKRLGHRIPEEVKQRGLLLGPVAQQIADFMGLPPFTIVHGDCHLENSYFCKKTGELGFYDMQLMRIGKGAIDLASFMGGSFSADLLGGGATNDAGENELLREYLSSLKDAAGGSLLYVDEFGKEVEYDFDLLRRDYRLGMALLFIWNVAAALAVPFDTNAHLDYDMYAERLVASVHRTSAINFALWYFSVPGVSEKLGLRGGTPSIGQFGTPPIQRMIPGLPTNERHSVRVHESIISPEEPVGFFDKYIRKPLKYALIHRMTSSRKGHHGQSTTEMPHEELEGHHSINFAEGTPLQDFAMDSYYLSSFSTTSPSFALRWCRRYKESNGEVWLIVKLPDENGVKGSIWTWTDHPVTTCRCFERDENTVVVQGKDGTEMSFECVAPMQTWRAVFNGRLRNQQTREVANVTFALETSSCMPHFAFASNVSPALVADALSNEKFSKDLFAELKATHQEHYEQFCYVKGSFHLSNRQWKVDGKGMRDRAFGSREWGYMQRYFASYFCLGQELNGPSVSIAVASLPTMTAGKFGLVAMKDGVMPSSLSAVSGHVATMANDGIPPREWEMSFCAGDTHYLCRAFALPEDSVGLNMQNAMWVNFRWATFELYYVDPATGAMKMSRGIGASEFGYRFEGYQPFRPKTAIAAPVHAKTQ